MFSNRSCFVLSVLRETLHKSRCVRLYTSLSPVVTCQCQSAVQRKRLLQEQVRNKNQLNYSTATELENMSLWARFKYDLGFPGNLQVPKRTLIASGYNMYMCTTQLVDYQELMKELNMPDTFNSWFLITELHVWLCMVKLASMGIEGRLLRNNLVQAMWSDIDKRSKQLGNAATLTARTQGIKDMGNIFYGSLFSYDEGLLSDDRVLAGAVWRTLLEMREVDAETLALMVEYIRKQVHHLDKQDTRVLMSKGLVTFLPLIGDNEDTERNKAVLAKIFNRQVT